MSIRGSGKSGNGEPSRWFKETIAEIKELQRETLARIARSEDEIDIMKQNLAENRRQTRELISLVARIDEQRRKDNAVVLELLAQHNMRIERLEKKK